MKVKIVIAGLFMVLCVYALVNLRKSFHVRDNVSVTLEQPSPVEQPPGAPKVSEPAKPKTPQAKPAATVKKETPSPGPEPAVAVKKEIQSPPPRPEEAQVSPAVDTRDETLLRQLKQMEQELTDLRSLQQAIEEKVARIEEMRKEIQRAWISAKESSGKAAGSTKGSKP